MGKYQVHQSDTNEGELIAYLEERGAQVEKIHQPVDLLICFQGVTAVAEVKTLRGNLNAAQKAFMGRWDGIQAVLRMRSDCDALLERMAYPNMDYVTRRKVGLSERERSRER